VADEFEKQWNFPHCVGALDGKHVRIEPPPNSGSLYYNYKQYHSIVLMALVDAQHRFLFVDIGCYGRVSDGGVFNSCGLSSGLERNSLNIPAPSPLPHSDITVPYVVVADDAFALRSTVMKPYPLRNLTREQRIYNYRLSRARRVVENTFGIMCSRFRIFGKAIGLSPEKVQNVVMAACCIHNFLLRDASSAAQYLPEDVNIPTSLNPLAKPHANHSSTEARSVRDSFCRYFCSAEGAVSWQDNAIM